MRAGGVHGERLREQTIPTIYGEVYGETKDSALSCALRERDVVLRVALALHVADGRRVVVVGRPSAPAGLLPVLHLHHLRRDLDVDDRRLRRLDLRHVPLLCYGLLLALLVKREAERACLEPFRAVVDGGPPRVEDREESVCVYYGEERLRCGSVRLRRRTHVV